MRYGDVVQISDAILGDALLMVLRPSTSADWGYHPSLIPAPYLRDCYVALILDGSVDHGGIRREAGFIGPVLERNVTPLDPA